MANSFVVFVVAEKQLHEVDVVEVEVDKSRAPPAIRAAGQDQKSRWRAINNARVLRSETLCNVLKRIETTEASTQLLTGYRITCKHRGASSDLALCCHHLTLAMPDSPSC
jgi:hypothetical protein